MNKYAHEDGTPFTKEEFLKKLETDSEFNEKFGNKGIDQISDLIKQLKENPDSRRLIVNAWAVDDLSEMVLPPCHYGFQVYTRELSIEERHILQTKMFKGLHYFPYSLDGEEGLHKEYDKQNVPRRAISLMYNTRSQDIPLGTPFNISSYALLLMIIAKQVNMVPDELITNMGDCHIYLNQIEGVKEQLTRAPYKLSTVKISDKHVNDISEYEIQDFILQNYQHHPTIKIPLSN